MTIPTPSPARRPAPPPTPSQARARAAARLGAVQALYQREMGGDPVPKLLTEFHNHRLGQEIEGDDYPDADQAFFDDVVAGVAARQEEIDAAITAALATGWAMDRLDKPMRALLRAAVYELLARADVPAGTVINEYVDISHAFHPDKEAKFVNGLLDTVARRVRG
ncbi:antitermination protein NusB [alpha proteobacterium AAP81b]|nr:antitermination protein NusB [alpha proteobacterium AAP81b]